ncbi:hypothetical protein PR048_030937 [Dryococelus australis]|uniref:Uncharacterized protein n=1 Tax=Dryococelus australis TaxID=614101 RepID=A0ABQ9GAB2_9NEOP|nr:hypothetical protein PR048_030937 [Dryococelus australis]
MQAQYIGFNFALMKKMFLLIMTKVNFPCQRSVLSPFCLWTLWYTWNLNNVLSIKIFAKNFLKQACGSWWLAATSLGASHEQQLYHTTLFFSHSEPSAGAASYTRQAGCGGVCCGHPLGQDREGSSRARVVARRGQSGTEELLDILTGKTKTQGCFKVQKKPQTAPVDTGITLGRPNGQRARYHFHTSQTDAASRAVRSADEVVTLHAGAAGRRGRTSAGVGPGGGEWRSRLGRRVSGLQSAAAALEHALVQRRRATSVVVGRAA